MDAITSNRRSAAAAGLRHYYTGKPCKHGHLAQRRTTDGQCTECCSGRKKPRAAIAAGAVRYFGRICSKHPALQGERYALQHQCVGCKRDRKRQYEQGKGRQLYLESKARQRLKRKAREASDPLYAEKQRDYRRQRNKRLRENIGSVHWWRRKVAKQITRALQTGKAASTVRLLGTTIGEYQRHLEGKFLPGMTWDNYGDAWHIDHIIPLSHFDLRDPAQQFEAFNYKNTRPLWAGDNLRRGNRMTLFETLL